MEVPWISVEEMRRIDMLAVEHFGVEVVQMMEHAGRAVAEKARDMVGVRGRTISILVGKGNNGGDGLVAGRFLTEWGAHVNVLLSHHPDELKPLVKDHLGTARAMHQNRMTPTEGLQWELALKQSHLIVDGLIGYNLKGNPRGHLADLITLANHSGKKILAIDCPSGLDCDTGEAGKPCIRATETLALTLPKKGLKATEAGKVFVADMGVPHEVYELMSLTVPRLFEKKGIIRA